MGIWFKSGMVCQGMFPGRLKHRNCLQIGTQDHIGLRFSTFLDSRTAYKFSLGRRPPLKI